MPANATDIEPPNQEGYAAVWNSENWDMVEDHRKQKYWLSEDKYGAPAHEMKELGPLPEGATLTAPEKTLDEAKADKVQQLKWSRDAAEVEPIDYDGNKYDYDDKARDRINAAIIALDTMGEGASIIWTLADNTNVTVTADDLRGVIAAVAIRSNTLHIKYRNLKEQVLVCTDKDAVEQIAW
ncbi:MAG: DUF4376 domain-containing protein [Phascolarctobacterium sp.]